MRITCIYLAPPHEMVCVTNKRRWAPPEDVDDERSVVLRDEHA